MADEQISDRIEALVKEEHELLDRGGHRARARRGRSRAARGDQGRARPLLGSAAPAPRPPPRRRGPRGRQPARRRHRRALPAVTVELGAFVVPSADGRRARSGARRRARRAGSGRHPGPPVPAPLPRHLRAAGLSWPRRTERVRLFPAVANLPLRHPAMLAKEAATIDVLSGGRFELGLGAGAFWEGIEAFGGPRRSGPESVDALEEAIAILRACWSGERVGDLRGRALPRARHEVRARAGAPDRHLARRLRPADDADRRPARRRLVPQPAAAAARRAGRPRADDRRGRRARRPRPEGDPPDREPRRRDHRRAGDASGCTARPRTGSRSSARSRPTTGSTASSSRAIRSAASRPRSRPRLRSG